MRRTDTTDELMTSPCHICKTDVLSSMSVFEWKIKFFETFHNAFLCVCVCGGGGGGGGARRDFAV